MSKKAPKYPGIPAVMDGNTAAIACERESTDAAGAFPITPSTQMGEYFEQAASSGHLNISGRPLIFIEPEGEHASAAVTAGLSMTGLRSSNFSSGQGIAYMHESLYAAVGKRLTYVLNMGCRAMTKASLNVHAGHDDYHAIDDTGFFQLFAKNVQQVADLNIIAHRLAELALTPGIIAQDGFLTTHLMESMLQPERELIAEFLGKPSDLIECPTQAQKMLFGPTRRRIPLLWDVDNPLLAGPVQNQESYMQSVAAQRPYFFAEIRPLLEQVFAEFYALTHRRYQAVESYLAEDAEYLILGQGSVVSNAEAVADHLRKKRGWKVGVLNLTLFRPFPGRDLMRLIKGKKGVTVLERLDQPLAEDLPIIRELRSALTKSITNGLHPGQIAYPGYEPIGVEQAPELYSASFGMGSRDLQPEALIGAFENMLEGKKRFYYLSIDFLWRNPATPKLELYQQQLLEQFPNLKTLAVQGSENPNLLPEGSLTLRIHSIGGWGGIAMGKSLALTLADLLGFYAKANPKYGSEKKGQPTTFFLSVAPEPIRVNCEYFYVDAILAPDPNLFEHQNPLGGLKQGGLLILQSDQTSPEAVWNRIPARYQKQIVNQEIRVFYLDAFKIAQEEAQDPELLLRMQGTAFQGAFFQAGPLAEMAHLNPAQLLQKIQTQLEHKFGKKGQQVVEDNLKVVQRGFQETREITQKTISTQFQPEWEVTLPEVLKTMPRSQAPLSDLHRFWEETGYFYKAGKPGQLLADPFTALSLMPAASGWFRDMTEIRFEHPQWVPEKCTGCGKCWAACPDSALPGLVNEPAEILAAGIQRLQARGEEVTQLHKALRPLAEKLHQSAQTQKSFDFSTALVAACQDYLKSQKNPSTLPEALRKLQNELAPYEAARTRAFYDLHQEAQPGSGGLLSITLNPQNCKGCMECVAVCQDAALLKVPQTPTSLAEANARWALWQSLPSTQSRFMGIENLEEAIGPLERLLLDKKNYFALVGGDGACLGCSEKSLTHLFLGTLSALMQPRVKTQVAKLEHLIEGLTQNLREQLTPQLDSAQELENLIGSLHSRETTLRDLHLRLQGEQKVVDAAAMQAQAHLISELAALKATYTQGLTGQGRSLAGIVNATGCSSVWGSTYPFNPYPIPWVNHLFQDSPSIAMGVFEGHMSKMAENFRRIRQAEQILGERDPEDLTYFDWQTFTDEEFLLCPPVIALGGDGAMYDIGFQNLSRMMMTGKPIKVLVLDTQVYSNTGGQACTSGFAGQVSDMATFGKRQQGKQETRKELGLIAMCHRTTYVAQSSLGNISHLLESFIQGLQAKRPALFNLYSACQPEHGIGDDRGTHQAKLALETRTYPHFRYDPSKGATFAECLDLEGNPDPDQDWVTLNQQTLTFADFAATEGRFRPQFTPISPQDWKKGGWLTVAEYLALDPSDQAEAKAYLLATTPTGENIPLAIGPKVLEAAGERQAYWRLLRSLAQGGSPLHEAELIQRIQGEMVENLTHSLIELTKGGT